MEEKEKKSKNMKKSRSTDASRKPSTKITNEKSEELNVATVNDEGKNKSMERKKKSGSTKQDSKGGPETNELFVASAEKSPPSQSRASPSKLREKNRQPMSELHSHSPKSIVRHRPSPGAFPRCNEVSHSPVTNKTDTTGKSRGPCIRNMNDSPGTNSRPDKTSLRQSQYYESMAAKRGLRMETKLCKGSPSKIRSMQSRYCESMVAKGGHDSVRHDGKGLMITAPVAGRKSSTPAVASSSARSSVPGRISSMHIRYHDAMAAKGRRPHIRVGSAPLMNSGSVGGKSLIPALSIDTDLRPSCESSKQRKFYGSMAAKGGQARTQDDEAASTNVASVDMTISESTAHLASNHSPGTTRRQVFQRQPPTATPAPTRLARGHNLQTSRLATVAVSLPNSSDTALNSAAGVGTPDASAEEGNGGDAVASAFSVAPTPPESATPSVLRAEEVHANAASVTVTAVPAPSGAHASPRSEAVQANVIGARLEEADDHIESRFSARLEEQQNNLAAASVVNEGNSSPLAIAASPCRLLFLYCIAVLVPIAITSVVIGVVQGGRGRGTAPSSGDGFNFKEAPTKRPVPTEEFIPSEPARQPTLSTDPVLFAPHTSPPTPSTAAAEMPGLTNSPCTSGLYYFIFRSNIWVLDVLSDFSSPEKVTTPDCELQFLAFDRNGTGFGVCFQEDSPNKTLVTVDLQSGATTEIVVSSDIDIGLVYYPEDDHLYSARWTKLLITGTGIDQSSPIKIDKNNGSITFVESDGRWQMQHLHFDSNGNAIAYDHSFLYFVNLTGDGSSTQLAGTLPNWRFAVHGFRGTTLYGSGYDDPSPRPLFALNVTATTFTTARTTYYNETPGMSILDGAFCPK